MGTQGTCGISITGGSQNSAAFSSEQIDLGLKLPSFEQGFGLETPRDSFQSRLFYDCRLILGLFACWTESSPLQQIYSA